MSDQTDLQFAAEVAPLVDPDRLKLARELRGWTQAQLVSEANGAFTTAALSQLERGHTRPLPSTLLAVAEVTGCPLGFFVGRPADERREGFFRSLQATPARERQRQLANARLLHELVAVIEEHVDLPDVDVPWFGPGPHSPKDIEELGLHLRRAWNVEDGPIPNVVRTIERHGVVIVRSKSFTREVDAFSVRHDGRPIVVLGSEKGVTARSRFDAAHELGHLILHDDKNAGQRITENEAHQFAASFLMPAAQIRRELPSRADWSVFTRLKSKWRVSIAALLYRAKELEVMAPHTYVNAIKTMSARGWRTKEPGDEKLGPLEAPVLLSRALDGLAEMGISLEFLVEEASLPLGDVERLVELTRDPRPSVKI